MVRSTRWNTKAFEEAAGNVGMERLEKAANIIRDDAERILRSKVGMKRKGGPVYRPPKPGQPVWQERWPGAMADTLRVVRKKGSKERNIRIYAGNFKTWWAKQMEYGRGGWKGGRMSFLRPAMKKATETIKRVIEGGV